MMKGKIKTDKNKNNQSLFHHFVHTESHQHTVIHGLDGFLLVISVSVLNSVIVVQDLGQFDQLLLAKILLQTLNHAVYLVVQVLDHCCLL